MIKYFVWKSKNMINKINKERRRSINATPYDPATITSGKEPMRTQNKDRTGHKKSFCCFYDNAVIVGQVIRV
jgi:hypothetical protein